MRAESISSHHHEHFNASDAAAVLGGLELYKPEEIRSMYVQPLPPSTPGSAKFLIPDQGAGVEAIVSFGQGKASHNEWVVSRLDPGLSLRGLLTTTIGVRRGARAEERAGPPHTDPIQLEKRAGYIELMSRFADAA